MTRFFHLLPWVLILAGCQVPPQPTDPVQTTLAAPGEPAFRELWQASLDTLRNRRFRIDRKDLHDGVITTHPLTSQHFLEFWRRDVCTPYDLAESSMQTIRRSVEIQISRQDDPGDYLVDVTVHRERFNTAERQINNAAGALHIFSTEVPTTEGEVFDPQQHTYWSDAGRDGTLEQEILEGIKTRYSRAP